MRNFPARSGQGFTLVEMTCAILVMSLILLGIQSVVVLASRSGANDQSRPALRLNAAKGIEMLNFDLPFATSVGAITGRSITFSVPDRTGDGVAETIRYSWSGTSGDPLVRSINGGADVTVVANLGQFALSYDTTSTTTQNFVESAETLLQSYDALLSLGDSRIQEKSWVGQYFVPTLPAGATSWSVTRVKFKAKTQGAASGETRVQIRRASSGLPTTVIDEAVLAESSLGSSYSWQQVTYSSVRDLKPSDGLCLVLQWQNDVDACAVQIQALASVGANSVLITTSDGGATWSQGLLQDMLFYVYGTYTTQGASTTTSTLRSVSCTITPRGNADAGVKATIPLLNPQVVTP